MKKAMIYWVGTLTLLLASCMDEPIVNNSRMLRVTGGLAEESRTALVQNGNVTETHWAEGDKIGLFTGEHQNLSYQALSSGTSTEFVGGAKELYAGEGEKVWAYYPYSVRTVSLQEVDLPYTTVQTSDGEIPVCLYSESTVSGNEVNFKFNHLFAYLRLTITAKQVRELKYSEELTFDGGGIYIASTEPLSCYQAKLNMETQEIANGDDCMRVIYYCRDINVESDGSYTYMIPVLPQSASASVDICIFYKKPGESGYLYPSRIETKRVPSGGLKAGHVYNVNYAGKSADTEVSQVEALKKLYEATGGDQWYNKGSWLSNRPLDEWYGVNAGHENFDYVHSLDLSYNNLTGSLPAELAVLMDKAESIKLDGNLLTGDIPEAVRTHEKWSKLGWDIIHQDLENGGGFNLANSGFYGEDKSVTNLLTGATTSMKEFFAQNKLTQVIMLDPFMEMFMRDFTAKRVNTHLDYRNKGLGTVLFTGAEKGWGDMEMMDFINTHYEKATGVNWLYGFYNAKIGYSYIFNSEGQLVHIAPYRQNANNDRVHQKLDEFLRATLGEPESHAEFKMNFYTSTDYSRDGEVYIIQEATVGKGIDIVLMGEGFTDRYMDKGGAYERKMKEAAAKIFSMEPYSSLRNRFNVYGVKVVSPNESFSEGALHAINKEPSVALTYASLVNSDCPLVGVIYNTDHYTDRSHCYSFTDGSCVAFNMDKIDNTLIHEMCGHGIAWLADEYVEPGNEEKTLPEEDKEAMDVRATWRWGDDMNVDYRSSPTEVRWARILADSRFSDEELGVYEGAFLYGYGAYRSSENSMMRYNISYFNAPSREAIYKAVMMRSEGDEWKYDYEEFVKFDEAARNSYANSRSAWTPLTEAEKREILSKHRPPIFVNGSWRDELEKAPKRVPLR